MLLIAVGSITNKDKTMLKGKRKTISGIKKLIRSLAEAKETVKYNSDHNRYYNWLSSTEEGLFGRFKLQLKEITKQPLLEAIFLSKFVFFDKPYLQASRGRFVWYTRVGIYPLVMNVWKIKKPFTIRRFEFVENEDYVMKEIL